LEREFWHFLVKIGTEVPPGIGELLAKRFGALRLPALAATPLGLESPNMSVLRRPIES
jgi:hypothetical protein